MVPSANALGTMKHLATAMKQTARNGSHRAPHASLS
jgi:hypothetical protein